MGFFKARISQQEGVREPLREWLEAKLTVIQIPIMLKRMVLDIKDYVTVIDDIPEFYPSDWKNPDPEQLRGAPKIVYVYCQENKLHPTISYWSRQTERGTESGYELTIHPFS